MQQEQTRIGTLKVRGVRRGDPALRLAISNQLGGADLHPTGMPPSAVLIVRQIADPLPGRLTTQPGKVRPDPAWERAANERLADLYRRAARPQRGVVAGNAEAIVFDDEAELLACLALDFCRGQARQRWWWRLFLTRSPALPGGDASIGKIFFEEATCLPAMLEILTRWGKTGEVLRALNTKDIQDMLIAMLDAYEVLALLSPVDTPVTPDISLSKDEEEIKPLSWNFIEKKRRKDQSYPMLSYVHTPPPWVRYLDRTVIPSGLDKERIYFLVLGLMLHRMPRIVRSSEFQEKIADWWHSKGTQFLRNEIFTPTKHELPFSINNEAASPVSNEAASPDSNEATSPVNNEPPFSINNGELSSPANVAANPKKKERDPRRHKPGPGRIKPYQESTTNVNPEALQPFQPRQSISESGKQDRPETVNLSEEQDISAEKKDFILTRIGGVLYLINLILQLDLPHLFEKEWRITGQLGLWGLLELLGRALFEDNPESFEDDPLWMVLAELDGRKPGEMPGGNFSSNIIYRLPVSWFDSVSTKHETFRWATADDKLRLWSSAGYMIVEIPRDENPADRQAEKELQGYLRGEKKYLLSRRPYKKAPLPPSKRLEATGLNQVLLHWLNLVISYIRYRLQLAFECKSAKKFNIARRLLICPGKLYVSSTNIDFITDIENTSLAVRKTGLDRDPGWLIDFGRVVKFHFE